jgi:GT2 family glycosyltransferase
MVRGFARKPKKVMVLVPKILIRDTNIINSVGMRRIRPTENLYTNIGYWQLDTGHYDRPQKVEAFDGSAFMFRKELLSYTYLFDTRFFFGNETVDLAERMNALGLSAWTCPRAVVRHDLRGTVKSTKENDWLISIIVRNSLIHTMKNTSLSMFMRTLIIGILVRNVFGRLLMRSNNARLAFLYMRGVVMFILAFGSFATKPYRLQPRR